MILDIIHHGDALNMLRTLPDECVQCCITSPPYWGLRDYGVEGQLGLEPTPEQYVERMVEIFAEVRRLLRMDGTLWLNLGDCYATGAGSYRNPGSDVKPIEHGGKQGYTRDYARAQPNRMPLPGLKPKDLIGIPWRVAFALQADGWYLRSDIIWSKPNPMPESIRDRPTKAHEYVFLMSKSSRYYYDQEAVREKSKWDPADTKYPDGWETCKEGHGSFHRNGREKGKKTRGHAREHQGFDDKWDKMSKPEQCSNGRNRRTVWTIPTRPYPEAHFAVFPETLVEPCLLAGSAERDTILDPFMGSGTVAKVAMRARRHYIGIELNQEYIELAEKRIAPLKTQGNLEMEQK